MNNKQLYRLSKEVSREIFLEGQLSAVGANQATFMEKLEKNQNSMKTQEKVVKVMLAIVLGAMSILPLFAYMEILGTDHANVAPGALLLASSIVFSLAFVIQVVYILILGLMTTSALMSGDTFNWLETLPLSKKDVRKLSIFALFRSFNIPLVVSVVALPTLMGIFTHNPAVVLGCGVISASNTLLAFSLLILLGGKFSKIMQTNDLNTKRSNRIRILTLVGYGLGTMMVAILAQYAFFLVEGIFEAVRDFQGAPLVNYFASLVPFPFAGGYLLSLLGTDPASVPPILWVTAVAGMGFLFVILRLAYRKAGVALRQVTLPEDRKFDRAKAKKEASEAPVVHVKVEPTTPVKAYIHKDLSMATRDIQMLMFLIMPFLLPFITGISFITSTQEAGVDFSLTLVTWVSTFLFGAAINGFMLVSGMLNVESSGTSITAALPMIPRDQANGKLILIMGIPSIAYIAPLLVFLQAPYRLDLVLIVVATLGVPSLIGMGLFSLKVALFGRMRFKYVLEEVRVEHKAFKWIVIVLSGLGLVIGLAFLGGFALVLFGIGAFVGVMGAVQGGLGVVLWLVFNRMFPDLRKGQVPKQNY